MSYGKQYRQGDLLFIQSPGRVASGPDLDREEGTVVLARGEVTGHAHRIPEDAVRLAKTFSDDENKLFLEIVEDTQVTHEEHGPIDLPKGNYEVRLQREETGPLERPAPPVSRFTVD